MAAAKLNKKKATGVLNEILELELAGVVRYTHYSFMVFGHHRIPIVKWLRGQADESLLHAVQAGEHITALGGEPSLGIGGLLEKKKSRDVDDILRESLTHERKALATYEKLLGMVEGKSVMLEEYARTMIGEEEQHATEVEKMLRKA